MSEMLTPLMLIVLLSLSNAQWPLQSIGYDELRPIPRPLSQSGYPYDEGRHFGNVPVNPKLNLPERIEKKLKDKFEGTKLPSIPEPSQIATNMKTAAEKIKNLSALKFPVPSAAPKIANVSLSTEEDVRDKITNLLTRESALRNDTDFYMKQFNLLYLHLAIDESDNELRAESIYKYGMSLILRFLLEFYRIFRKFTSQSSHLQLTDAYGTSYDRAVAVMKEKKHYTPLQISAPVRRSADIFKSIIYESVLIVQTKCSTLDPNWKCLILYFANLISESLNCSNVWYHAFIHILALETKTGIQDSIIYKIANFDKFNEFVYFENIFDFVIEKLQEYREVGRVHLSAEALFFTMLADLQENGFLDCVSIDYLYN